MAQLFADQLFQQIRETVMSQFPFERPSDQPLGDAIHACCEAGYLYVKDVGNGWVRVGLTDAGDAYRWEIVRVRFMSVDGGPLREVRTGYYDKLSDATHAVEAYAAEPGSRTSSDATWKMAAHAGRRTRRTVARVANIAFADD